MSKSVVIAGMNWRISLVIKRIVFVKKITSSLILFFLMHRETMEGLLQAPLSLTTIQVLVIHRDIHQHNHRDILSLTMLMMYCPIPRLLLILMMGRPIPHLLLPIFHQNHSLHLQMLLKREIYLERELKLILCANTGKTMA